LGGLAEHLLRLAPCNLLLAARSVTPPDEYVAGATTAWSEEATARMKSVPAHAKGVAMAAIQRYAVAEGFTMITSAVVDSALEDILPPAARAAMGIGAPKAPAPVEERDLLSLSYLCPSCRYVHARKRPETCPVCGGRGSLFQVLSRQDAAEGEELQSIETFDGVTLSWTRGALALLQNNPDFFLAKRARHQIEKNARRQNRQVITVEFVSEVLGQEAPQAGPTDAGEDKDAGAGAPQWPAPAPTPEESPAAGWSAAGWQRLLHAPEGFMRDRARDSIEKHARQTGAAEITLDVAEAGMVLVREEMLAQLEAEA
jgi:hypothetical protein